MKLTKRACDAAEYPDGAGSKRHVVWDGELKGFGLRVYPSGAKSFVYSYRANGRKRLRTLGPFGPMTVQQARKRAAEARVEVADGKDPVQEARKRREATKTVRSHVEQYINDQPLKASTEKAYRRLLEKHIGPRVGHLAPSAVTVDDVRRLMKAMEDIPYQSNRALFLLGAVLRRAKVADNPVDDVKPREEARRERYLSPEELSRLGDALRRLEGDGVLIDDRTRRIPWQAAACLRLLLFTGARSGEILNLRWEHVDLDRRVATIPDHKSKTTTRNAPPRRIILPEPAVEILEGIPRAEGDPWVLPGRKPGTHFFSLHRSWRWVRIAANLEDVRIHDLRHSHASWAASSGLSLLIVGQLLGHSSPSATQRYAHLWKDTLTQAAESVSGGIKAAMEGKSGDVVEFPL